MRKLHKILYMLLVGVALTSLTACGDDNDYSSAPKVSADNIGAYFAASNAADEILTPEEYAERPSIDLTVKRASSQGDTTVAVVVDRADEVFEIPSTVAFKDGETEATLTVGCKNLEALKAYRFTIHLDENATNPYVKVDGSSVFNYQVMVARWIKVVENAKFTYQDNLFPAVTSDIYELEGQNKFKIENFLGSGVDLSFKIIPQDANGTYSEAAFSASDKSTWKGVFMPLDHFLNDEGGYWYLMNDVDAGDYASWTPKGSEVGIDYINFYNDGTENYSSIDMNGSTTSFAGFLTPYIYYSNGSESGYTYVFMYW